ncbi:acid protease [Ramaria rubella]|nr:acid protease [Ramaria rubella]
MLSHLSSQVLLASTVVGASMPHGIHLTPRRAYHHPRDSPHYPSPSHPSSQHTDKSKSVTGPLQNLFQGTDLQWFGNIGFGTPPQTFGVVFDTGSFDIEIPGIMCALPCNNQRQFDYTTSSTFVDLKETATIHFETAGGVQPGNTESIDVLKVADTMMLIGIPVPHTEFYLITNQTAGFIPNPYDGIVGLGYEPNSSIYTALRKKGLPALFSLYLTPRHVGKAEITLGGIDAKKLHGSEPHWAPILNPKNKRNSWSLSPAKMSVNGRALKEDLYTSQPMVFDSGTSNIVMSQKLTKAMYAMISPYIQPIGPLGAFGMPCAEIPSLSAEITFTFHTTVGKPFNLTIPSKELSVGPFVDNPSLCQTLINSMDIEGGIIGGSLLKYYYSVWDVDHARIGFKHNGF